MSVEPHADSPRLRGITWRLLWISVVGGLLLAVGLAVAGTMAAGGGFGLFAELVPAMIFVGVGMAIPPVLGAVVAIAAVGRPPRSQRRERWAAAIGGVVGAFVSPVLFYSGWAFLGVVVGMVVALAVGIAYPLVLRSLWRRASPSA